MVRKRCQNSDFLGEKYRIILQIFKIGPLQEFEKNIVLFSCTMLRKKLYSDQNWFLRPFSPLIGGIYMIIWSLKVVLDFRVGHRKGHFKDWEKVHFHHFFLNHSQKWHYRCPQRLKLALAQKNSPRMLHALVCCCFSKKSKWKTQARVFSDAVSWP